MKLSELIKDVEVVKTTDGMNIEITGVAYDSRKIQANDVFVCVEGFKVDGHNYIEEAMKKGAKALIVEKDIMPINDIPVIKVDDSRKALAVISSNFYRNPTKDMNIIGVTGTNGKTTTTHLIKNILETNHVPSGLIGTISYQILDKEYKANNTTPESLELQRLFREMLDDNVDTCVMEVSSHSLDMNRVAGIQYNVGVFTNLTPDHMDYHVNIENYKNAKTKLFYQTSLANIINIDDPYGKEIAHQIKDLKVSLVTYGVKRDADIYAQNIRISPKGTHFALITPKFRGNVKIATPGMFSVYNALAASAVCYVLGYDFEQIRKGLESIQGVPGRFESVQDTGDYTIIVDYAHTPDALENALNTMKEFAEGKIITVFGCGGDRDKTKRPMMGAVAGRLSDYCIITSDNPRSEEPKAIIDDIEVGIKDTSCKYKKIVDRKEAIKKAIEISKPKDIILIAGKGHETYQILGDKVIHFDDKEIAQKILREEA
ncbi:UDP-N-acetylmuramoyl-L-alanyl-D-glutamate--2,6-diaminopimelate ligase [Clostridiaceae bacterium 35-E11]